MRPGHVGERHARCHFVVDADIGAERVRVFGVGVAIAIDVALGAHDIEAIICLAEIELDLVTRAEKPPHGRDAAAEDTAYLGTHGGLSKIFGESDVQPSGRPSLGTTPGEGRKPTTPQIAAGIRNDPPVSEPVQTGSMSKATATT